MHSPLQSKGLDYGELRPGPRIYPLESLLRMVSARNLPLRNGPTEIRIIARFSMGAGATFGVDDLQLIEEPLEGGTRCLWKLQSQCRFYRLSQC
jgi:hypothetical protein